MLNENDDFVGFDVVIGNPPYLVINGGRYNNGGYSNDAISYIRSNYKTGEQQINTFPLFIELTEKILTQKGFNSLIIPNTFLGNEYSNNLRDFIIKKFHIIELYNTGSVFDDASVETIIITCSKKKEEVVTKIIYKNQICELFGSNKSDKRRF